MVINYLIIEICPPKWNHMFTRMTRAMKLSAVHFPKKTVKQRFKWYPLVRCKLHGIAGLAYIYVVTLTGVNWTLDHVSLGHCVVFLGEKLTHTLPLSPWEVESFEPVTGPTLSVLKLLRRMCCLCYDIRMISHRPPLLYLLCTGLLGTLKNSCASCKE